MLYRVANLRASRDKRLRTDSGRERYIGDTGTLRTITHCGMGGENVETVKGNGEVFFLVNTRDRFATYRYDELEEVTQQQLQLEHTVLNLLSAFPSDPTEILGDKATPEDRLTVFMFVKTARNLLKKHPLMRLRNIVERVDEAAATHSHKLEKLQRKLGRLHG